MDGLAGTWDLPVQVTASSLFLEQLYIQSTWILLSVNSNNVMPESSFASIKKL